MSYAVFIEIATVVALTIVVSAIMRALKQPLIIGYILTGILVSPAVFNIVKSTEVFPAFSEIGVAILLFMVGIHLNPKVISEVGKVSTLVGMGQVIFTASIGFAIALLLGFTMIVAIYVSVALTFSSTIIIMKLLSDKGELETLHGKITLGVLIIQDIVAMIALILLSTKSNTGELGMFLVDFTIKIVALLIGIYIIAKAIFPWVMKQVAKSQEFLLFFSIGWCLVVASVFASLNFSIEAGALIAGISLSMSPFRYEISSKLKPLRDFFILLFFVVLGSQMVFSSVSSMIVPIIIFSFFILIGNPLIVMIIMGLMGYTKRNALFTGLAMAQISEFSLIVVALGVKIGHISGEVLSFVTIIGIITIAGSSYYMLYNDRIYNYIYKYLRIFERKGRKIDEHKYYQKDKYSILLFGYHRIGFDLVETFKKMKKSFMVIDSNPDKVIELAKQGVDCRYGDADDIEFLNELNIKETKMIVSTIPDLDTNLLLIKIAKELNKDSIIIVVSNHFDNSVRLYEAGADYVIMPHLLGGKHTSLMIQKNGFDAKKFMKEKLMHLGHMEKRKNLLKRGD